MKAPASASFRLGVDDYLAYAQRPSRSRRPPTTDAGRDKAWLAAHGDEGCEWVLITALAILEAAHQHLRGLGVLSQEPNLDVPLQALARPCVEASATIMWVLDAAVDEATRVERALNITWDRQPRLHQAVRDKAAQYGFAMRWSKGKRPREMGVGNGILRGADLLQYVLGYSTEDDIKLFWSWWSSSSHGDLKAGMSTWARPPGGKGWGFRRAALSLAAVSHYTAFRRFKEYEGDLLEEELEAVSSRMKLAVLTMQMGDPS